MSPRKRNAARLPRKKRIRLILVGVLVLLLVTVPAVLYLDPGGERAYQESVSQAAAAYQQGNYDEALSCLRRAEGLRHSEENLMLMADCYEAQDKLELALETLRRMDTGDSRVAGRIASLEQRRLQDQAAESISLLGRELRLDSTELDLTGTGLTETELEALAPMRQLESLKLGDNPLGELSALRNLGGLTSLDLSGDPVEDLGPIASLGALRRLCLDRTKASDFSPLYGLSNLTSLSLMGLELSREQLADLTGRLPGCAIHTEDPDGAEQITLNGVSFFAEATSLDLSDMGLRDLSGISSCAKLKYLRLNNNQISDLQPLMNLSQLQKLELRGNVITDLRPLMGILSLRDLSLSDNSISDTTALASLTELESLDLSGNPLEDLSGLQKLSRLRTLHLERTGLRNGDLLSLQSLKALSVLVLDENPGLTDTAVSALKSALPGCRVSTSELVYSVKLADSEFLSDLKELDLSGRGLDNLSGIERFRCLEKLVLSRNEIGNLFYFQFLASRESLRELDLSYNEIDDLAPLADLSKLETLDLSGNKIENTYPLDRLKGLKKLYLTGNPISAEKLEELREALPDCEIIF